MESTGETRIRPDALQFCWSLEKEPKLEKEPQLHLTLEIAATGPLTIMCAKGRIVYRDEAASFLREGRELLSQAEMLVVDLSQVEMIDGAGLGSLLSLLAEAKHRGTIVKLLAPSRRVRETMELTKVASLFEIHPTIDQAFSSGGQIAQAACCN